MSKSKSKGAKDATMAEKVKDTVVNKPVKAAKVAGKELAKPTPVKEDKKSKKKVKEPTPEPSDSESDATASTASSDESESESEDEVPVKNGKVNGVSLKQAASSDASDDESDSSESSDEEAPKLNGKAAAVNAADSEQDSDDSEEDSDEETVVETIKNKGAVAADELSKKLTLVSTKRKAADSSDEDSDESAEDEEEDEAETGDDSDEEEEAKPKPAQKRKAEEAAVPAAKKTKTEEVDESRGNNLFVGNLSWNVDEAWLTSEFESYGELSGVRIITDRDSGRSKGFGYVEFVNAADAAKAFDEMKGHELDGRAINVDFAAQRTQGGGGQDRAQSRAKSYGDTQSPPSDTLFVGNLSFDVGQDTVSQAFGEFGTIMGVRLPTDRETGNPKGFGYVTFASVEEAQGAMEAMQGYELEGRTVRLDYSQPRPQNGDSPGGRGGFGGRGRGRGGFDRGGRGGGRGRGGFGDRGGRGGRGGFSDRGGRGGSTNRGGFGDFKGKKVTF